MLTHGNGYGHSVSRSESSIQTLLESDHSKATHSKRPISLQIKYNVKMSYVCICICHAVYRS